MSASYAPLRRIVLASSNRGKLDEIREVFADTGIELIAQSERHREPRVVCQFLKNRKCRDPVRHFGKEGMTEGYHSAT